MKTFTKNILAAASVSVMALAAQAETTLIANEPGPNRGVRAKAVSYIAEQITERTGGEVKVEQNWGGALFKTNAALQSLGLGVADMGVIIGAYSASEFPELQMAGLQLKPAHPWVMMQAMYELFTTNEKVQARLDEMNVEYILTFSLTPGILVCSGDGIRKLSDAPGTKIAHTGSSTDIFGELGGNLVSMPIYDVYQGMETGLVECSVSYAYYTVASKLNELIDTITDMRFSSLASLATVVNKDTFNSLTPEQQEIIRQVGRDTMDYYAEQLAEADIAAMKTLTEGEGAAELVELPEEDYARMSELFAPSIENWKADMAAVGMDGDALMAELYELIDKWTGVMETEGLPWERG
ncbi:C4-dicarboxylate TRAP transporter substrate-binding protein [Pseudooceanicola nitratireducens]|uniref:C4-dicarboxylate TRAP transporter substrate-binding protein n=1 Tax=Pseudooceanicola nitratireducens TaxID=517719 RepID=UPI001C9386E9|nr:C4-dicarboxylate TRAP transporter substrate-binding protein [Pseudooceanicola nitratireducens]MBY6159136.1 C4-dicarboxylate TRAP transporter substrate-binding protein [Pseudooceanicola nitratireducens]